MKFLVYIFFAVLLTTISTNSYAQGGTALLSEDCKSYPGLVNKIVKCVTRMTAYGVVGGTIGKLYDNLLGVSNAAMVLYIAIFGFKMALGGVAHLRREAFFLIATAVAVLTFNNTMGINRFLNIFLRAQAEFANAAVFAVSTKPPEVIKSTPGGGGASTVSPSPQNQYSDIENSICYGPKDKNYKPKQSGDNGYDPNNNPPYKPEMRGGKPVVYNIWQRVDCIIGYVIGAHPLVEKLSQYYDPNGEKQEIVGFYTVDNRKFDSDLFAGPENPFADMATDPFCFLTDIKYKVNPNFDTTKPEDKDTNPKEILDDGNDACKDKKILMKKTGTYEVGVSFSLFVVAIGMFFESAKSGGIGLMVLLTGIFIVFLMISAFGQVMIVYISSMFAMVVLALFAPIAVPCILFKPTANIFKSWLQRFFGYTLQPGIMLAYLAFMIFVIQYMIDYSKPMTINLKQCTMNGGICSPTAQPDNSACGGAKICTNVGEVCQILGPGEGCVKCPAECVNASADPGFNSLAQMNFGGIYKEGFKDYTSFIRTIQGTTTKVGGDESAADYALNTSGTVDKPGVDKYTTPSMMNLGAGQYSDYVQQQMASSMETATNLASVASDSDINLTGAATSDASVPGFQFAVAECTKWETDAKGVPFCPEENKKYVNMPRKMADYIRTQQNTNGINGIVNLNGEDWAKDFQNSGRGGVASQLASINQQQWNSKANYMQVLLVVFLTLSITISFMHNVMTISDQITGAGMRPISKMVDIYNLNVSRASKVIRS